MAFRAEELTAKIFPSAQSADDVPWQAGCPQDTLVKGKPCAQNTHPPCAQNTHPPAPPPCPNDTHAPHKAGWAGWEDEGAPLALLQSQLRDRLAARPAGGPL